MAYPKRLNALNCEGQDKSIESHVKFVRFVAAQVQKEGMKNVLVSQRGDELYWLKKAWDRVLNFAENVQLKKIPQKVEGGGENGEFVLKVEISNENQVTPQSGNRISEYLEV